MGRVIDSESGREISAQQLEWMNRAVSTFIFVLEQRGAAVGAVHYEALGRVRAALDWLSSPAQGNLLLTPPQGWSADSSGATMETYSKISRAPRVLDEQGRAFTKEELVSKLARAKSQASFARDELVEQSFLEVAARVFAALDWLKDGRGDIAYADLTLSDLSVRDLNF